MKYVIALTLIAAVSCEVCQVSDWGSWGSWNYPNHDNTIQSFPALEETGQGERMREELMRRKMETMKDDFLDRPSEGRVDCVDNFANDLPCLNVDQLSFVSIADFLYDPSIAPKPPGSDLWGWVDPLNGDEYAIMGIQTGTSFLRITDPENPVVVGHLPTHSSVPNIWRDIKVFNNFAYIVADVADHGVQVFDLSRLRTAEGEMFTEDNHYAGVGNCHNIVSNEETGYMYAVGCTYGEYENLCGGGLHAINVNDPLNPVYEGCFGGDGYVHDAECVIYHGPDVRYQGSEICLCYNEDTLTVVDATDKANMVMLSRTGYSTAMYTHQGWLTDDHRIALLDDELDEMDSDDKVTKTYIWNVDDLEAPVLENTYRAPVESLDHNMYINGNLVYQSNYQAGMRILSLDRENYMLQEVAYLDVYPASTEADWNGSWSVYPYFPSGNVPVTSSPFGLFTVLPDYVAIDQAISETKAPQWRARYREVLTMGDNCPALVDIEEM